MLGLDEIVALVTATGKAVDIFDKISGQIKSVLLGRPKEDEGDEERWSRKISAEGDKLVVKQDKREIQTITADELKKLPAEYLGHIQTYEARMERNYRVWQRLYLKKDASPDEKVNALVDEQLVDQVRLMKSDLTAIIGFLQKIGLWLDDHYMQVRDLVENVPDRKP